MEQRRGHRFDFGDRTLAVAGQLPGRRPRPLLPRAGSVDAGGQGGLPGLRRARRLPRVRPGQRREVRHLGRAQRAGAATHPPAAGPRPPGSGLGLSPGFRRRRAHPRPRPASPGSGSYHPAAAARRASIVRDGPRSSSAHRWRRNGVEHRRRHQAHQLGPVHRRPRRHGVVDAAAGPTTDGSTRFIDTWARPPTSRPSARTARAAHRRRHPPGLGRRRPRRPATRCRPPAPAGPRRRRRRRWGGRPRPGVGRQPGERRAAARRAATAPARRRSRAAPSSAPAQAANRSRAATASAIVEPAKGHERHHVDHAEPGVHAVVAAQVEPGAPPPPSPPGPRPPPRPRPG